MDKSKFDFMECPNCGGTWFLEASAFGRKKGSKGLFSTRHGYSANVCLKCILEETTGKTMEILRNLNE